MRKIIYNKVYDTSTAKRLAKKKFYGAEGVESTACTETLYQKRTGEHFLHIQGESDTKYAKVFTNGTREPGEEITPLSGINARNWLRKSLPAYESVPILSQKPKHVGEAIKTVREQKRLTQGGLAERAGLTQSRIGRYETGKIGMTLKTLQQIADALETPAWELLRMAEFKQSGKEG